MSTFENTLISGVDTIIDTSGNNKYISTLTVPVTTTGVTSIDLMGIPSGVKEVNILLFFVVGSDTSDLLIQIGSAEGIKTTGYESVGTIISSFGQNVTTYDTGFGINLDGIVAQQIVGRLTLSLQDSTNFTWGASAIMGSDTTTAFSHISSGVKSLTTELTQVRITYFNGTDTITINNGISLQYSF